MVSSGDKEKYKYFCKPFFLRQRLASQGKSRMTLLLIHLSVADLIVILFQVIVMVREALKKIRDYLGIFPNIEGGGGGRLNPKTFVSLTIALKTPLKHLNFTKKCLKSSSRCRCRLTFCHHLFSLFSLYFSVSSFSVVGPNKALLGLKHNQ